MSTGQIGILAAIILYLAAMVYVGFYFSKKGGGDSADEFYLGGRKLGALVTAMSAEASDMSSWLLMGLPGVAYLTGIADAGWTAIGLAVGTYLNWLIVAKRLRRYSVACDAITIPDFFSRRYRDEKNILMCIAALVILIFFIPYTASGFKAVGTLFNSLFGVNYHVAMIVGAVVIIGYTVLGGFMAVSTTDLGHHCILWGQRCRGLGCGGGQCPFPHRIPEHDPYPQHGRQYSLTLWIHHHTVYPGLGAGIFRDASYPSALHGNQP